MNAAHTLECLLPWNRVDVRIKQYVQATPGPLCVACSGGPDSMALLAFVRHYWKDRHCILLHYNHRVREASQEEERCLSQFAHHQGIKLEVGHRPAHVGSSEAELREARYHFFRKMMRLHEASLLFVGHHQDDLFETVIMRLVRGSSLEGLIAPKSIHKTEDYVKIRPLLSFSKAELVNACEILGIQYFTDNTNASDMCLRNRVRHHLLNAFDSVFSGIHWRKSFAETCRILDENREFLAKQEQQILDKYDLNASVCPYDICCENTRYGCRVFLKKWFEQQNIPVGRFEQVSQILDRWISGEDFSINLDSTHRLECTKGNLRIHKNDKVLHTTFEMFWRNGEIFMPNRYVLTLQKKAFTPALYRKLLAKQWVQTCTFVGDAAKFEWPLFVRHWQPGDAYCPLGKKQDQGVKHMFSTHKISVTCRHQLPVICTKDGSIVWIPGLPPADKFKVTDKTKMCIFLFYHKI